MSPIIQKLIGLFSKFPTIGNRTATRFVFYLIREPKEKVDELIAAIQALKNNVKCCAFCFNPFQAHDEKTSLCEICRNLGRDRSILCIVEKENDLIAIENTKKYKGLYLIAGEAPEILKKTDAKMSKIEDLKERVKNSYKYFLPDKVIFSEIIIAINPTQEGKIASALIDKALKEIYLSPALKITHLAKGIPVGGELEYADEETLESALDGRK
ncbi:MAG: recombination protein RecR [Candidatus Staskawiczbacteria bacterium]|nr:recombination protein RecR [Candidatus Staskawiczbacteria bacterium]